MLMNDKIMCDRYNCINSTKTHQKLRKYSRTLFFSRINHLHHLLTRTCFLFIYLYIYIYINMLSSSRGQVDLKA